MSRASSTAISFTSNEFCPLSPRARGMVFNICLSTNILNVHRMRPSKKMYLQKLPTGFSSGSFEDYQYQTERQEFILKISYFMFSNSPFTCNLQERFVWRHVNCVINVIYFVTYLICMQNSMKVIIFWKSIHYYINTFLLTRLSNYSFNP